MHLSNSMMNRVLERRAAEDPALRRELEQRRRPLLSHARALSDEELVARLRSLGVAVDRQRLEELTREHPSAQSLARAITEGQEFDESNYAEDWLWFALVCLWERWLPERPNMEMLDDHVQAGYEASEKNTNAAACRVWKQAWHAFLDIAGRFGIGSISDFDDRFGGTQSVFNWVQDYESALLNASRDEKQFARDRIELCETVIRRFDENQLMTENFRRGLAEAHFVLGESETGDRLYRQWLEKDPQWGWGWIGWSDCYYLFAPHQRDAERASEILRRGLAVPEVRDRADVLDRLHDVLSEVGRKDEANAVLEEARLLADETVDRPASSMRVEAKGSVLRVTETLNLGEEGLPVDQFADCAAGLRERRGLGVSPAPRGPGVPPVGRVPSLPTKQPTGRTRVGRNDPCPCGSGKKFKKCCGGSLRRE